MQLSITFVLSPEMAMRTERNRCISFSCQFGCLPEDGEDPGIFLLPPAGEIGLALIISGTSFP
jgi:hypothetical protein